MIGGMVSRAEFRFNDSINIDVPSQLSFTTIFLRMKGIYSEQTSFYPISGFPRSLIAEDMINGTSLTLIMQSHWLTQRSETCLDKRAELIKERRYDSLAISNNPRITPPSSDDRAPEMPTGEIQDTAGEEAEKGTLIRAVSAETTGSTTTSTTSTGPTSDSRTSSQTLVSQQPGGSSFSESKKARQHVSIADIKVQAQAATQDSHCGLIIIKKGDKLDRNMSTHLWIAIVLVLVRRIRILTVAT